MTNWSAQQEAIFEYFATGEGNRVVRARAGTGKTTTMVEGVSRAPESQILMAAFNNRIAKELVARVPTGVRASTLHSLGNTFMRENWGYQNTGGKQDRERGLRMADLATGKKHPKDILKLVAKVAGAAKRTMPFMTVEDVAHLEDTAAHLGHLLDKDWKKERIRGHRAPNARYTDKWIAGAAYRTIVVSAQTKDGEICFDDMLYIPLRNNWVRARYDLVVIDEAQDMNAAQIALARGACSNGGRLVVVGDDRQAIYGFMGADTGSIDRLKEELEADEMGLTTTYRCGKSIVALAAQIVPDFEAHEGNSDGTISEVDEDSLVEEAKIGDFVLSRVNAPLASICLRLLANDIPARIEGRDVAAGLVALVKRLATRDARNSIPNLLVRLNQWAMDEILKVEENDPGNADDRIEIIRDKKNVIITLAQGLVTPDELKNRIWSLFPKSDDPDSPPAPAVVCSSIHKAKGLEADRVFILESTLMDGRKLPPHRMAEESNLRYVAITRAKNELVWVR